MNLWVCVNGFRLEKLTIKHILNATKNPFELEVLFKWILNKFSFMEKKLLRITRMNFIKASFFSLCTFFSVAVVKWRNVSPQLREFVFLFIHGCRWDWRRNVFACQCDVCVCIAELHSPCVYVPCAMSFRSGATKPKDTSNKSKRNDINPWQLPAWIKPINTKVLVFCHVWTSSPFLCLPPSFSFFTFSLFSFYVCHSRLKPEMRLPQKFLDSLTKYNTPIVMQGEYFTVGLLLQRRPKNDLVELWIDSTKTLLLQYRHRFTLETLTNFPHCFWYMGQIENGEWEACGTYERVCVCICPRWGARFRFGQNVFFLIYRYATEHTQNNMGL